MRDLRIEGKHGLFRERRLHEGAGHTHHEGAQDTKREQIPDVREGSSPPSAEIFPERSPARHESPEQPSCHVHQRPREDDHIRSRLGIEQPVHQRIGKQRDEGAPPRAQQERGERRARHVEVQDALKAQTQHQPEIIEQIPCGDNDGHFIQEEVGGNVKYS